MVGEAVFSTPKRLKDCFGGSLTGNSDRSDARKPGERRVFAGDIEAVFKKG